MMPSSLEKQEPKMRLGFPMARAAYFAFLLLATGAGAASDTGERAPAWPDSFIARVEALALLQTLNAALLSHDSATLTLDQWCDAHRLASPARIVAERVTGMDTPPTPEQRQVLGVGATDLVRYRHVRLRCGGHILSEADNWYVPARLTPDMNRQLDTTDIAFGRAVQALHFQRRTLSAKLLWSPLPEGWEMGKEAGATAPAGRAGALPVPPQVLEHRAILALPDGTPFSMVVETYTNEVLAFPVPEP
jgi:chorismate-pyruvate lyase